MQLNAVVRIEDGQVTAERFASSSSEEFASIWSMRPPVAHTERRLAAAAAEHPPADSSANPCRPSQVSAGITSSPLNVRHGIPVGDHEIRVQTERPRMPQAAVRTQRARPDARAETRGCNRNRFPVQPQKSARCRPW